MTDHDRPGLPGFVGRAREIRALESSLRDVQETGAGRMVMIRGRRRVGKSWLVEEFLLRQRLPNVFFTASRNPVDGDLGRFAEALLESTTPEEARAGGVTFGNWEAALIAASNGADRARPSVIVIDEFPYLGGESDEGSRAIESLISAAWERRLSRMPVLLVLVGSDLAMMERLTEYGRPLYDRAARILVVEPLTPGDIAEIAGLMPVDAFDAYAVIGGLPAFAATWRRAGSLEAFLGEALASADTPFANSGQRILEAEFPTSLNARAILSAVGHGERTLKSIADAIGASPTNLGKPISALVAVKRVVRAEEPLSAESLNAPRYSIADPYLRFWLRFVEREMPAIERLHTDEVVKRILTRWPDVRGTFVEPILRDAFERTLPDDRLPGAAYVGSYWTRKNDPQIDLIGADKRAAPAAIAFVGSIKWRERAPFDDGDLQQLIQKGGLVPGVGPTTPLVAISRTGVDPSCHRLTLTITPDELTRR
jgi:AAA+ ATPase superfamily predicted ATPase